MLAGMCASWLHSRGNDREWVCGHNSPTYMEVSRKKHTSFVGGELSFLKLGSVLVGLRGVCQLFLESQHSQIADLEVKGMFCL